MSNTLKICTGPSRMATEWELHELSWEGFASTLSDRMQQNCGTETHAGYIALPKAQQADLKVA